MLPAQLEVFYLVTGWVWESFTIDGSNDNNNCDCGCDYGLQSLCSVLCAVYDPLVGIPRGSRESPLSVPSACVCVRHACVCFIFNFHRSLPASLFLRWNLAQRIFFHRFILFCYVWRRVVSSSCLFMIFFPLCVRSLFCLLFIVVMPALNECNKSWLPFIFIAIDHNIFIVQFIWFTSKEIKWTS